MRKDRTNNLVENDGQVQISKGRITVFRKRRWVIWKDKLELLNIGEIYNCTLKKFRKPNDMITYLKREALFYLKNKPPLKSVHEIDPKVLKNYLEFWMRSSGEWNIRHMPHSKEASYNTLGDAIKEIQQHFLK